MAFQNFRLGALSLCKIRRETRRRRRRDRKTHGSDVMPEFRARMGLGSTKNGATSILRTKKINGATNCKTDSVKLSIFGFRFGTPQKHHRRTHIEIEQPDIGCFCTKILKASLAHNEYYHVKEKVLNWYPDIFPYPIYRMTILPNVFLPEKKFTESNLPNNYFSE